MRGPTLRRGCSIGAGAVLLPGITIGEYAIVGAGAVVSYDVPPRKVAVGNPARVVKDVAPEWLPAVSPPPPP
jgi:UDP-2-acetamido-3-amino-2,3-dideoxy-glucuronate N-acetyltransferase